DGSFNGQFLVSGASTSVSLEGANTAPASISLASGAVLSLPTGSASMTALSVGSGGKATVDRRFLVSVFSLFAATLTRTGGVEVGSWRAWDGEGTVSGTGSRVHLPGSTATLSESTKLTGRATVEERRFANEGMFTLKSRGFTMSKGAKLINKGTFNSNGG